MISNELMACINYDCKQKKLPILIASSIVIFPNLFAFCAGIQNLVDNCVWYIGK